MTTTTTVGLHHRLLQAADARHTQEIQGLMQRQQAAEARHMQEVQGVTHSLRNLKATFHHQLRTMNEHISANTASVQKDLAALRLQLEQSTSTELEPRVLVEGKGLGPRRSC